MTQEEYLLSILKKIADRKKEMINYIKSEKLEDIHSILRTFNNVKQLVEDYHDEKLITNILVHYDTK